MPRIAGVNIPENKKVPYALSYIRGIGKFRAFELLAKCGISPEKRANQLTTDEIGLIRDTIEKHYHVEGELRQEVLQNIRLLKDIGSYRGTRHAKNLPVRGQRTRTNTRTVRGNVRRTVGSGKRKLEKT